MPKLWSVCSSIRLASFGVWKLGQPQPASNLVSDRKSGAPQQMQR
jgi:hypothetical protein